MSARRSYTLRLPPPEGGDNAESKEFNPYTTTQRRRLPPPEGGDNAESKEFFEIIPTTTHFI